MTKTEWLDELVSLPSTIVSRIDDEDLVFKFYFHYKLLQRAWKTDNYLIDEAGGSMTFGFKSYALNTFKKSVPIFGGILTNAIKELPSLIKLRFATKAAKTLMKYVIEKILGL